MPPSPLNVVMKSLNEMYDLMPEGVTIRNSCVTGYGEGLIKEALIIISKLFSTASL